MAESNVNGADSRRETQQNGDPSLPPDANATTSLPDNNCLSPFALQLFGNAGDQGSEEVPPNTPQHLILDCYVTRPPFVPSNADGIEIPRIREVGVRESMVYLANFFNCEDYRVNLVNFWFLDIITDIIWRCQDEYQFPIDHQKAALEWIFFLINLMAEKHMSRDLFFEIFKEAVRIAEDYVQTGCDDPPTPNNLFILKGDRTSVTAITVASSEYSIVPTDQGSERAFLAIKRDDSYQLFRMPDKLMISDGERLSSSVETIPEPAPFSEEEDYKYSEAKPEDSESSIEFYKANSETPSRFKSNTDVASATFLSCFSDDDSNSTDTGGVWQCYPRKDPSPICPKLIEHKNADSLKSESTDKFEDLKTIEKEVFKAFYEYNLWQIKNECMSDPKKGWNASTTTTESLETQSSSDIKVRRQLLSFIEKNKNDKIAEGQNRNIFVNSCLLMAVKQFARDYFYDNFSFRLIRAAFKNPQFMFTQDLNDKWCIPKQFKGDFKKPQPKKPKKEKPTKEKKQKPDKKEKSKEGKGSKKSDKSDKKSKKAEKKGDKGSKASKKTLTKEEKLEQDRLKKLQEEEEMKKRTELENKRFMFPLKDAVNDDFFAGIFPNYKQKKGGKGDGDGKKAKGEKGKK